jgi:hypothetical protein
MTSETISTRQLLSIMESNPLIRFIDEYIEAKTNNDYEKLKLLISGDGQMKVTFHTVADALSEVMKDLTLYSDASQAVQEMRLLAIIKHLPAETQEAIKREFEEAEDDLLDQQEEN